MGDITQLLHQARAGDPGAREARVARADADLCGSGRLLLAESGEVGLLSLATARPDGRKARAFLAGPMRAA